MEQMEDPERRSVSILLKIRTNSRHRVPPPYSLFSASLPGPKLVGCHPSTNPSYYLAESLQKAPSSSWWKKSGRGVMEQSADLRFPRVTMRYANATVVTQICLPLTMEVIGARMFEQGDCQASQLWSPSADS